MSSLISSSRPSALGLEGRHGPKRALVILRECFFFAVSALPLVITAPLAAWAVAPAGRYIATGGIVRDTKTGLDWQQMTPTGTFHQTDAVAYCRGTTHGLGSGWRLPNIRELQTLVDGSGIDRTFFPSTPTAGAYFWSSTKYAPSPTEGNFWQVNFGKGTTEALGSDPAYVRCVR